MKVSILVLFPVFMFGALIGLIIAYNSIANIGKQELDAFNRINKTGFTMDEWRVYKYAIKKHIHLR